MPACDAIASLGPLDAFAAWFEGCPDAPARVVALGSTSVHGKAGSPDPDDYLKLKQLVVQNTISGAAANGVATIDVAVETLKVAEYLTPILQEQLM